MDGITKNYSRTLTRKERATMELLIEGKRDKEIALLLCVAPRTIGQRIAVVCDKLGALNRVQAAVMFAKLQ